MASQSPVNSCNKIKPSPPRLQRKLTFIVTLYSYKTGSIVAFLVYRDMP